MLVSEVIAKAQVLIEALPYIQGFRGSTFVIKYGGSFMDDPDPEIRTRVAGDIAFLHAVGIHAVVVHGGGKAVSRAMGEAGIEPRFVGGLRVTDAASIEVVRRVLGREINQDVCEMIQVRKGRPQGIHGEAVLVGKKLEIDDSGNPVDLGFVGTVTEVKVKLLKKAIAEGYTPVISPVALGHDGQAYNVNADVAAAAVAASLRARRLVYLSDVPGLLADPANPASLISTVRIREVEGLKRTRVIDRGMLPKINSAIHALNEGVHRVHFIDGRMPHSLLLEIFTDKGIGTEIVH
ncbi:MAG: acetylglutamate kinase [Puniceicoccaceae bacterium]|nr:MAG: acetylglutamate kinase [Puniceicoccaceae bacterium]